MRSRALIALALLIASMLIDGSAGVAGGSPVVRPTVEPVFGAPIDERHPAGSAEAAEAAIIGGPKDPSSDTIALVDLPDHQHLKNVGGRDGAGLCVFTSGEHAARWQRVPELFGWRDWMRQHPGGGYPSKVDEMIRRKAPGFDRYIQAQGVEPGLRLIEWAARNRRMACVTYGFGERYGESIHHMVNLVHLDDRRAAILDNNFPRTLEWMSRDEFLRRWKMNGGAWAYVLLDPPPPPAPVSPKEAE